MARRALAQGLVPATISSDLHAYNVDGPVYDLVTTASKFLHLGLSLEDVLARITAAPARAVGVLERVGTLAPGAEADVTLLRVVEGEVRFRDSLGQVETGNRRIEAVAVVRAGRVWSCTPARRRRRRRPVGEVGEGGEGGVGPGHVLDHDAGPPGARARPVRPARAAAPGRRRRPAPRTRRPRE